MLAFALAALLLPSSPQNAFAIVAGQLIAASNFLFLRTLVTLFTERRGATLPQGRILFTVFAKLLVVYGGAFALIRVAGVAFAPFSIGLGLPLLTLFLKSVMAAFHPGPSALTPRTTSAVRSAGDAVRLGAFTLLALFALTAPALCLA
ncbi:MAG TPA: hypothetical protein VI893_05860, partial [Thermoplasmata archaeon]|nr:hypothetical protein [Thermoplasmata archaeon]